MHQVRIHFTASILFFGLTAAFPAAAAEEVEELEASPLAYRDEVLVASGAEMESLIERDFIAFDPAYKERRKPAGERLHDLAGRLATIQATGNGMACSNQIFLETKWLYHYTADWVRLEAGLDRLEESLGNLDQAFAAEQSPEDGSWGPCHEEWFHKAEATFLGAHDLMERGQEPKYPISLFDRFNTPLKLREYLEGLLISDIAHTGRDNRAELGGMATLLSMAYFKDYLQEYLNESVEGIPRNQGIYPLISMLTVYEEFIWDWQDPETGYWGAWYLSDGKIYKSADLSITYHTISYRKGDVNHWPQIVDTTFQIKNEPYPYGWIHDGRMNNHNNYDVARIWRYGWPHMTAADKTRARDELDAMLDWSLNQSLRPDGSFETDPTFFSSLAADYYFGVSFLDQVGFFDKKRRFWTEQDFPNAKQLCCRIKAQLLDSGLQGAHASGALNKLGKSCAAC